MLHAMLTMVVFFEAFLRPGAHDARLSLYILKEDGERTTWLAMVCERSWQAFMTIQNICLPSDPVILRRSIVVDLDGESFWFSLRHSY